MSRRSKLSYAGWAISDQALSSATNVALLIFLASSLEADGFGAFALCYGIYTFAVQVNQAAIGEPMIVSRAGAHADIPALTSGTATSTAVAFGAALAACTALGAAVATGILGLGLACLAPLLPGLLMHDTLRLSFIAEQRPIAAFMADSIWGVLQVAAFVYLAAAEEVVLGTALVAWGGAGTVAAVAAAVIGRVRPTIHFLRPYLATRSLAGSYVLESVCLAGSMQLTLFLVSAVTSLATVGHLRAAQALLGPVNVLLNAVRLFGVHTIATAETARAKVRRAGTLAVGALVVTLCFGLVLLLIPDTLGASLLGQTWTEADELLAPLTVERALSGASVGLLVALRVLAPIRETMVRRLAHALAIVVLGTVGAWIGGGLGAALGLALASGSALLLFAIHLTSAATREKVTIDQ